MPSRTEWPDPHRPVALPATPAATLLVEQDVEQRVEEHQGSPDERSGGQRAGGPMVGCDHAVASVVQPGLDLGERLTDRLDVLAEASVSALPAASSSSEEGPSAEGWQNDSGARPRSLA